MKHVRLAALAGIVALAACSDSPVETTLDPSFARNGGAQQSVSGHVELDLSFGDVPVEKYSFSAIRNPDGTVTGRFNVRDDYATDGIPTDKLNGRVTCFTILPDGKTARVAGIIEHSTNPFVPAGRAAAWTVRDNGEGQAQDAASDLRWGFNAGAAQFHCAVGIGSVNNAVAPNLRGNVQVRP